MHFVSTPRPSPIRLHVGFALKQIFSCGFSGLASEHPQASSMRVSGKKTV
jgi:hypothetical protein